MGKSKRMSPGARQLHKTARGVARPKRRHPEPNRATGIRSNPDVFRLTPLERATCHLNPSAQHYIKSVLMCLDSAPEGLQQLKLSLPPESVGRWYRDSDVAPIHVRRIVLAHAIRRPKQMSVKRPTGGGHLVTTVTF